MREKSSFKTIFSDTFQFVIPCKRMPDQGPSFKTTFTWSLAWTVKTAKIALCKEHSQDTAQREKEFRKVGSGFFLPRENYGGRFDEPFPTCTFFFSLRGQLTCTNSTLLGQRSVHMAQWAESTVSEHSLMSRAWVCVTGVIEHCAWTTQSANIDFFSSRV